MNRLKKIGFGDLLNNFQKNISKDFLFVKNICEMPLW
jgi:hypothetical protein